MWYKIEKIINISVGIMLLTNLYLFSGVFGIPSDFIIVLCLIVSGMFFLINFNITHFINQTNNWNTVFYVLISIPLCFIDLIINHSSPAFNDFIRVLIYCFYFSWTFSFYKDFSKLKNWFLIITSSTFIILAIQGLFESSNPVLFSLLFSGSNQKKVLLTRIGGSIVDPNSYAGLLTFLTIIIYFEWFKKDVLYIKIIYVIMCITTLYLIELSGSRQGLLMYICFLLYLFFKNINVKKVILLATSLIIIIVLITASWNEISTYVEKNPTASVSRFVSGDNSSQSNQSNLDRKNSLISGINLVVDNYFLYGPGLLNFSSRWENFSETHVPHNGIIFIFDQFGILGLVPLFILFKIAKRSLNSNIFVFFVVIFIFYSLLPNSLFYCTAYFVTFYIDTKYLLEKTK